MTGGLPAVHAEWCDQKSAESHAFCSTLLDTIRTLDGVEYKVRLIQYRGRAIELTVAVTQEGRKDLVRRFDVELVLKANEVTGRALDLITRSADAT